MPGDDNHTREILQRIKDDLAKTLEAHKKIELLRAKKLEQDCQQIGVYFDVLESEIKAIRLNSKNSKKIEKILSWKSDPVNKNHNRQQDQLEDHLIELQKLLVNLISKRFKY
jgi:hypothetical protein